MGFIWEIFRAVGAFGCYFWLRKKGMREKFMMKRWKKK
jgi:hypothetical protein